MFMVKSNGCCSSKQNTNNFLQLQHHTTTVFLTITLLTHLMSQQYIFNIILSKAIDKYMIQYGMKAELAITDEQRIYILIAAYAHDNGHQGLTNNFYINSESDLAIKYSYLSPLQNMHSSNLLAIIRQSKIQLKKQMKKLMIELILATDNKHHFQLLEKIKKYQQIVNNRVIQQLGESDLQSRQERINQKNKNKEKAYRPILLQMLIHTADINTCGKPLQQYLKWNQRLYQQFKVQYRKQIDMDIKVKSFQNFDLNKWDHSVANSNLGFFNTLVLPFFKEVSVVMFNFKYELDNAVKIRNHFQKVVNQKASQQSKRKQIEKVSDSKQNK